MSSKPAHKKLIQLEALRGFAAVYVVLHHTIEQAQIGTVDFSWLFRFGQEAVILFFLLSGFVIEYSFSRSSDQSFLTYFQKRFLRIYIPLFCVFGLHYLVLSLHEPPIWDWQAVLGNLFMLQDADALKPNVLVAPLWGNGPLWSLSYEWWFYMLYFPLTKYMRGHSSFWVYVLGVLAALSYLWYPNFANRILMYFVIWWCGVVMAQAYLQTGRIPLHALRKVLGVLLGITVILIGNVLLNYEGRSIGFYPILEVRHFVFAIGSVLAALVWQYYQWRGFAWTIGWFACFAPISFGLYITHFFLISKATYLDHIIPHSVFRIVIYTVVCLTISYLIERVVYVRVATFIKTQLIKRK